MEKMEAVVSTEEPVTTTLHESVAKPLLPISIAINFECEDGWGAQCASPATPKPPPKQGSEDEEEAAIPPSVSNLIRAAFDRSSQESESRPPHLIVEAMPESPSAGSPTAARRVLFNHEVSFTKGRSNLAPSPCPSPRTTEKTTQEKSITNHPAAGESRIGFEGPDYNLQPPRVTRNDSRRQDKRFDSFKTWSGRLERELSNLRGKPIEPAVSADAADNVPNNPIEILPVERYLDALQGPELETLKDSEELILPQDEQWPFLLRFPISSFGICLGVGSQAILWKTLATAPAVSFFHVKLSVNLVLWCIALALLVTVSSIYLLKIVFFFEAVRREYYHPVRVNFFFAPWIACLFLALGVPPSIAAEDPHAQMLWYVMMAPILCLELKIYGQWMSGGQRRLSKVANPSNHLAIVGNFVGALLGATMGLREGPIFFFAVGLAHYTVLFVTLYQRLPTNETLPKELHPVFFLFVAAPSVACTAWAKIRGVFDYGSKIAYFISLFLYLSLAVRVNFFTGFRFSLAWWAYTFPMAGASIATIAYANELRSPIMQCLSVVLSAVSTLTVTALLCTTVLRALVFRDLFPNDISIAISRKRPKKSFKKRSSHKHSSSIDARESNHGAKESV